MYVMCVLLCYSRPQVTQWLSGMRQQMCSNHGNIGDSLAAVEKLSIEHEKFSETAEVCVRCIDHRSHLAFTQQ